jgi:hypothetical protein
LESPLLRAGAIASESWRKNAGKRCPGIRWKRLNAIRKEAKAAVARDSFKSDNCRGRSNQM